VNDAAIIQATFATYRPVAGRKVLQLVMEVPIEAQSHVFAALGYPVPDETKWVAIALLRGKAEQQAAADPEQLEAPRRAKSAAQVAGILCNTGSFRKFIQVDTVDQAADYIRAHCRVSSRANIDGNPDATNAFNALKGEYDLWMRVAA